MDWKNRRTSLLALLSAAMIMLSGCGSTDAVQSNADSTQSQISSSYTETDTATTDSESQASSSDGLIGAGSTAQSVTLSDIPAYSGEPYVAINNNVPFFSDSDLKTTSWETYSDLDSLGRCGTAYANVGQDIMPTEKRGSIGQVKPTGWHTVKYDNVDGKYLYNRCHLIGYQLTAENANEKNLITGTRYLNVTGMLPFENMVADYVKETNNHVLYRVRPIFEGDNLVANGVLMEAKSVEDNGEGVEFNVFCYNVQPGISIDYATGDSSADSSEETASSSSSSSSAASSTVTAAPAPKTEVSNSTSSSSGVSSTYILNTNKKRFHTPDCSSVKQMKDANKKEFSGSRDELIAEGYVPCKKCNP